jgi:hypothetical protein
VALQGDLKSFALPDVLRLLAGTGKSGLLQVAGPEAEGELSLQSGAIVRGTVSTAPRASAPAEVVFELLRLDEGAFAFAEGEQASDGPAVAVDDALGQAEALLADWRDVETVVPSMDAWISLLADGVDGPVELDLDQWGLVVAIGSGGTVRDLAATRSLSDLEASQAVKHLAEAGLVDVRLSHATVAPSSTHEGDAFDAFSAFEQFESFDGPGAHDHHDGFGGEPVAPMTELEDLVVEDRPVVMEDRDDALLPEPLPGEGVTYEGETITGSVDGRTFDVADAEPGGDGPDHGLTEAAAPAERSMEASWADAMGIDDGLRDLGGADPFSPAEVAAGFGSATSADGAAHAPVGGPAAAAAPADDERGSLLKFLSTVKP